MSEGGGTRWGRIIVLGCVGLIVVGLGLAAAIFFFVMGAMKRSDVYTEAMAIVERSPSAIAALGEPMKAGLFVSGSINVSGGAGEANLSIPLRGPNGKGTVHAVATREAGAWVFTALHLAVDGGETLDLLAEAGTGAAGAAAASEAGAAGSVDVAAGSAAVAVPAGDALAALNQLAGPPPADVAVDPTTTLWVQREYSGWENPLHTEMSINGTTINIFTSDTFQPVAQYLRPGWNTI
ncbi:MAG TPA: cytochrome c oxidase assembly factor 1 family protein, partial [Thermoanaerobaculia bacterium]|nr:cytochrome c oxidase assembly factor 1 family protein [Thermoanaerobaculia bacterium]